MAAWADRVGLLLQFLAFWFVAPELLGRTRLEKMKQATERLCRALIILPVGGAIIAVSDALILWQVDEDLHNIARASLISITLAAMMVWSYFSMRRKTFHQLIVRLQDDDSYRAFLARVGAGCFTAGFVIQFFATYF